VVKAGQQARAGFEQRSPLAVAIVFYAGLEKDIRDVIIQMLPLRSLKLKKKRDKCCT
jgi:hypothetical protein